MLYRNILDAPVEITGLAVTEGDRFFRLPEDLIDNVSEGVSVRARHTSGGCVRFATDSPSVGLRVALRYTGASDHMPLSGRSGADVYFDGLFVTTVRPDSPEAAEYEGTASRPVVLEAGVHQVEIFLPLYNGITAMEIGTEDGARLLAPAPHKVPKPLVFYGSSITQGGCASKPGNSYCAMLARWLDAGMINLGFGGNCKGEENVAAYIASLGMSVFILDYDHNAPNVEHLKNTHGRFFEIIREKQPELPVILVTRPDFDPDPAGNAARRAVVRETYENAVRNGDRKVWFADGETLFGRHDRRACTVDGIHPSDLGFYRMAQTLLPFVKEALNS